MHIDLGVYVYILGISSELVLAIIMILSSFFHQVDVGTEELAEGEEVKVKESKAVKKARKKMAERRNSMAPIVNIPYVPQHR